VHAIAEAGAMFFSRSSDRRLPRRALVAQLRHAQLWFTIRMTTRPRTGPQRRSAGNEFQIADARETRSPSEVP